MRGVARKNASCDLSRLFTWGLPGELEAREQPAGFAQLAHAVSLLRALSRCGRVLCPCP